MTADWTYNTTTTQVFSSGKLIHQFLGIKSLWAIDAIIFQTQSPWQFCFYLNVHIIYSFTELASKVFWGTMVVHGTSSVHRFTIYIKRWPWIALQSVTRGIAADSADIRLKWKNRVLCARCSTTQSKSIRSDKYIIVMFQRVVCSGWLIRDSWSAQSQKLQLASMLLRWLKSQCWQKVIIKC